MLHLVELFKTTKKGFFFLFENFDFSFFLFFFNEKDISNCGNETKGEQIHE